MNIKDFKAYKEGYDASEEYDSDTILNQNPYPPKTDAWYSWNQGWNSQSSVRGY